MDKMDKLYKLYNFKLDGEERRDTAGLDVVRRQRIAEELVEDEDCWRIKSEYETAILFLVDAAGFADAESYTPWRAYSVEELEKEAIAIYIASVKMADDWTKASEELQWRQDWERSVLSLNLTPKYSSREEDKKNLEKAEIAERECREKYFAGMKRVIPVGIGMTEMRRVLAGVRITVDTTEWYDACRMDSEVKFTPDLYEVMVVIDAESPLLKRKFSESTKKYAVLDELEQEGRYKSTHHTVM